MRTTLTLDADVAEKVRRETVSGRLSLKQVINDRLRIGFGMKPSKKRTRFVVEPHSSPYRTGVDPTKLNQLVDELDAETFLARKRTLEK